MLPELLDIARKAAQTPPPRENLRFQLWQLGGFRLSEADLDAIDPKASDEQLLADLLDRSAANARPPYTIRRNPDPIYW